MYAGLPTELQSTPEYRHIAPVQVGIAILLYRRHFHPYTYGSKGEGSHKHGHRLQSCVLFVKHTVVSASHSCVSDTPDQRLRVEVVLVLQFTLHYEYTRGH